MGLVGLNRARREALALLLEGNGSILQFLEYLSLVRGNRAISAARAAEIYFGEKILGAGEIARAHKEGTWVDLIEVDGNLHWFARGEPVC